MIHRFLDYFCPETRPKVASPDLPLIECRQADALGLARVQGLEFDY